MIYYIVAYFLVAIVFFLFFNSFEKRMTGKSVNHWGIIFALFWIVVVVMAGIGAIKEFFSK